MAICTIHPCPSPLTSSVPTGTDWPQGETGVSVPFSNYGKPITYHLDLTMFDEGSFFLLGNTIV